MILLKRLPSVWTTIYDASGGLLPTDATFGFTRGGSAPTIEDASSGRFHLQGATTSYVNSALTLPTLIANGAVVWHHRFMIDANQQYAMSFDMGHAGVSGSGLTRANFDRIEFDGYDTILGQTDGLHSVFGGQSADGDVPRDVTMDMLTIWPLVNGTDCQQGTHEVWLRQAGARDVDNPDGYRNVARIKSYLGGAYNYAAMGYVGYNGYADAWVDLIRCGVVGPSDIVEIKTGADGPTVAITISPASITPGQSASAAAVIGGGAIAKLNDSAWDGSDMDSVTAVPEPYVAPTTPATPVAYRPPTPGAPSWSTDVDNIILSEPPAAGTGQLPVTAIWLGYQATPGAAPSKLTTGAGFTSGEVAASTVAVDNVTWTAGTGVVTAWADLVAAVRALFPAALICQGNDDGQVVSWSGGVSPTAQGNYELTLSGSIDPDRLAGLQVDRWVVEVRLVNEVTLGGRTYTKQSYRGSINQSTGAWSIAELPRGQAARIKLPYGDWTNITLADVATSTYMVP